MEIVSLLTPINVTTFLLLFIRFASFFSFIPVFNYLVIPMRVKAALSFWLTIVFFPFVPKVNFEINIINLIIAILFEVTLAFLVGSALGIIFDILRFAAEQISFVMGFTMASVFDPNFNIQSNIVSQFLIWISILVFIALGGDHLEIMLIYKSLYNLPFGVIFDVHSFYKFFINYMSKYFLLGFSIAFPIIAVSLFSDIVFGMIMKTMPQFNLLVVGFPIKIFLSFVVLISIVSGIVIVFSREIKEIFNVLFYLLSL